MNLQRIARPALYRCHVQSIARKLRERRDCIQVERGRPITLIEIAQLWQCSTSQVSRCLRGLFTTFDGPTFELRLRNVGSNLKDALANNEQIARAIVEATVAAALKARRIPKSDWTPFIPLTDSSYQLIRWIVANRPLPDVALTTTAAWEKWFAETLVFFEAQNLSGGRPELPKGTEAEIPILAAADWMAFEEQVKFFVPFQIAAIAFVIAWNEGRSFASYECHQDQPSANDLQPGFARAAVGVCVFDAFAQDDDDWIERDSVNFDSVLARSSELREKGYFYEGMQTLFSFVPTLLRLRSYREDTITLFRREVNGYLAIHADINLGTVHNSAQLLDTKNRRLKFLIDYFLDFWQLIDILDAVAEKKASNYLSAGDAAVLRPPVSR